MENIEIKIDKINDLMSEIIEKDKKEYALTLEIYNNPEKVELYKKCLYGGVIKSLSMLTLKEIRNALYSLKFKQYSIQYKRKSFKGLFFTPEYFENNLLFQLNASSNKLATLLKYKFSKPDGRYASDINRVTKAINKNPEYKKHTINKLIVEIKTTGLFSTFKELREETEHGLNPKYQFGLQDKYADRNMMKIIDNYLQIVTLIYNEHFSLDIKINDEDLNNYKIIELEPKNLEPVKKSEFFDLYDIQHSEIEQIINLTLNYFDFMLPWIKAKEPKDAGTLVKLTVAFMNDTTFRLNDAYRSFSYALALYTGNINDMPNEIKLALQGIDHYYFLNVACVRIYSVFDKIGLIFSRIFSMPKDRTFFKVVADWIINNTDDEYKDLKQICSKIVNSDEYKALDMIRQQYVHGFDLSVKQAEGTTISDEYIFVTLHHNINHAINLLKQVHRKFIPAEIFKLCSLAIPGSALELIKIQKEIFDKKNPSLVQSNSETLRDLTNAGFKNFKKPNVIE